MFGHLSETEADLLESLEVQGQHGWGEGDQELFSCLCVHRLLFDSTGLWFRGFGFIGIFIICSEENFKQDPRHIGENLVSILWIIPNQ